MTAAIRVTGNNGYHWHQNFWKHSTTHWGRITPVIQ